MKLTYGWAKGQQLKTPQGLTTRPTSSKVREALMNMLSNELESGLFIDIFAGSGAVGIDALSRGATGAIFIEKDQNAIVALKQNINESKRRAQNCGQALSSLEIWPKPIEAVISKLNEQSSQISVVWADPPYPQTKTWLIKFTNNLPIILKKDSIFALECSESDVQGIIEIMKPLSEHSIVLIKEKQYGETSLLIWRKN